MRDGTTVEGEMGERVKNLEQLVKKLQEENRLLHEKEQTTQLPTQKDGVLGSNKIDSGSLLEMVETHLEAKIEAYQAHLENRFQKMVKMFEGRITENVKAAQTAQTKP